MATVCRWMVKSHSIWCSSLLWLVVTSSSWTSAARNCNANGNRNGNGKGNDNDDGDGDEDDDDHDEDDDDGDGDDVNSVNDSFFCFGGVRLMTFNQLAVVVVVGIVMIILIIIISVVVDVSSTALTNRICWYFCCCCCLFLFFLLTVRWLLMLQSLLRLPFLAVIFNVSLFMWDLNMLSLSLPYIDQKSNSSTQNNGKWHMLFICMCVWVCVRCMRALGLSFRPKRIDYIALLLFFNKVMLLLLLLLYRYIC